MSKHLTASQLGIFFAIVIGGIAITIYFQDYARFNDGVLSAKLCERTFELGDDREQVKKKLASESCSGLTSIEVMGDVGRWRIAARGSIFYDPWVVHLETRRGVVTAVRYGTRAHPEKRPKDAPPDRVSTR